MIILSTKRNPRKPIGSVSMNWGHPLATGMVCCIPINENGPNWNNRGSLPVVLDACGNFPISFISASSNLVTNTVGQGYNFDTVSKYFIPVGLAGTLPDSVPTDGVTVLVIRRKTDTTARNSCLFGPTSATLSHRCNAFVPFGDGHLYWDFGGATGGTTRLDVNGLTYTTGVEQWAFTAGGKGMSAWRNGIKVGSQSTAVTRVQGAADEFRINSGPSTNGDLQDIFFFAVSRVQWDDSLVSWWMEEPYGMFVPQVPSQRLGLLGFPNITPPIWGGWTFPSGTQFVPYDYTWDMPTSAIPVTYSVVAGALPDGLSLTALSDNQAHIHGIPTVVNLFNFTLRATNAFGTVDKPFSITIAAIPQVFPVGLALQGGVVGSVYSETLDGQGGTAPYTFAVTAGSLPTSLSLDGSTGIISGTPTVAGTFNFTIEITDDNANTGSQDFSITISAPGGGGGIGSYVVV